MEEDVVIVDFTKGRGKYAGKIGAIVYAQWVPIDKATELKLKPAPNYPMMHTTTDDGRKLSFVLSIVGQTSGITDDLREDMTLHPDHYLGNVMKIEAVSRYDSGFFRHPQFKALRVAGDKSSADCIWMG
jgi:ATP-dependent DNA ligase